MSRLISKIYYFEIILVILMVLGVIPQESSFLIILVFAWSFYKMNLLDSLGLFIISIPFFTALPGNSFSDSMSIWRILAVLLFVKSVYKVIPKKNRSTDFKGIWKKTRIFFTELHQKSYGKIFIFFTLFIGINLISIIGAEYIGAGVKKVLFMLNIAILFPVVLAAIEKKEDLVAVLRYLLQCAVAVLFVGYFQLLLTFFVQLFKFWQFWTNNVIKVFYGQNLSDLLSYSNTWFSYYDVLPATLRMFSVFPDSHSFAMFILFSMPVALFFLIFETGKKKKTMIAFVMASLLAIYFSGSRGAWISSLGAVAVGFILFTNLNYKIKSIKGLIGKILEQGREKINPKIIVVSTLVFFLLMPISAFVLRKNQEVQLIQSGTEMGQIDEEAMFKRLMSISNLSEESNMGRIEIWNKTIESINRHYLLGVGVGNFPLVLQEDLEASKMGSSAHSIYFDIAAETGAIGLLAFLLVIFEILRCSLDIYCQPFGASAKDTREGAFRIFAGAFFLYFFWASLYGVFDVVLFNDKVFIFAVISLGVLYSINEVQMKENGRQKA